MGEQPVPGKHNRGCHCKKTGCLKKYCECFQRNNFCSENCKCIDCKNNESCEERRALYHGDTTASLNNTQLPSSAPLSGTSKSAGYSFPSPSKKRKSQEFHCGQATEHASYQTAQAAKVHSVDVSAPLSGTSKSTGYSFPSPSKKRNSQEFHCGQAAEHASYQTAQAAQQATTIKNLSSTVNASNSSHSIHNDAAAFGIPSSKIIYRSLLADVVQPETVQGLCKLLVIASRKAANACEAQTSMENGTLDKQTLKEYGLPNKKESSTSNKNENPNEQVGDERLEYDQGEKVNPGTSSCDGVEDSKFDGGVDCNKGRAMSPGTLALMCDEQDTFFTGPSSPSRGCRRPSSHHTTECFAEQERVILSEFRDCLKTIIDVGKTRAMQYSTEAAMSMKTTQQTESISQLGRPSVAEIGTVSFSAGLGSTAEVKVSSSNSFQNGDKSEAITR